MGAASGRSIVIQAVKIDGYWLCGTGVSALHRTIPPGNRPPLFAKRREWSRKAP